MKITEKQIAKYLKYVREKKVEPIPCFQLCCEHRSFVIYDIFRGAGNIKPTVFELRPVKFPIETTPLFKKIKMKPRSLGASTMLHDKMKR